MIDLTQKKIQELFFKEVKRLTLKEKQDISLALSIEEDWRGER